MKHYKRDCKTSGMNDFDIFFYQNMLYTNPTVFPSLETASMLLDVHCSCSHATSRTLTVGKTEVSCFRLFVMMYMIMIDLMHRGLFWILLSKLLTCNYMFQNQF